MGLSGRLEGIAPSDIFQIISQNRLTGTLIARCREGTAMVVFKNGQVIEAASDDPRDTLSSILVAKKQVSQETIEAAQERRQQEPDRPLGTILIEMKAISKKDLQSVVLEQIEHIIHRLASCEDGFFTFDRGETALKRKLNTNEFFLPKGISADFLMMESARIEDEERRIRPDRRTSAANPSIQAEHFRVPRSSGPTHAVRRLLLRLREFWRSTATTEALRNAVQTALQKGRQLTASAGDLLRGTVLPWLKTVLDKARAFSPDGRALIYVGSAAAVVSIALILLTTLNTGTPGSDLTVTGRVVKIRANHTTNSKVVTKVNRGDTVASLSFNNGWHEVRTKAGETGWIWQSLVERKEKKNPSVGYAMTGYILILIVGIALLATGIIRKRRSGPGAAKAS